MLDDMNVDILSGNEQREHFYDEDSADDNSDRQYNTWRSVGTERPHFSFSGKPDINVDLENQNNPLEYIGLFITPEVAEIVSRETNCYAQPFLENKSDLKLKSHRDKIMKLLTFLFVMRASSKT
jgi:hypothetical protein